MTASRPTHLPVMLRESLECLAVRPGGRYIDCTTGLGGHSEAIAREMGADGRLLCIDKDAEALEFARERLATYGSAVNFSHGNFRDLDEVAREHGFDAVDGVLIDLGISSFQLGTAERGFAFGLEGPLDMRMDRDQPGPTAAEIVNNQEESLLALHLKEYGEVRQARRIARAIVAARPLKTTWDLAKVVEQAVGGARDRTQIHPATQVFQALRILVNGELDSLDRVLPLAHGLLNFGTEPGGRLVVISFHSLEDRRVKQYMQREASGCICPPRIPQCVCGHEPTLRILTKKPLRAQADEVAANPRSRSAALRAAERIR
ncbi:MAG: 16S rRNA (cytosine(1402)-N(4))-methyltransferase RsmH [Dehalococcoidia bacterium]|nr:16S rRNA (cytosine(1402)-N(4))-methyltransferase RsmH [Dehalococcoidia bacterium]MCA9825419.1 16S rRNA (cytosine(1402)-N(4))-methyltransferase RsmH [Dehalococcoidia bacterium]MCA9845866.1 16S rRNA (cytosine(1402)-N(4))-methyltransferase RsmH [Dehalococcoidia bacterium]MCA9852335.1 16S rRNA (cytosine(1402)-N(4))-methyltransferase RsmH [Dehalococcoidia bacterium]